MLRPYQLAAIRSVLDARNRGIRRMVICLPTGAGKTVIFSHLAKLAKRRVLVLAHREELVQQAKEKLENALGAGVLVGIEQAEMRADPNAKVVVCSIRSLREDRLSKLIHGQDFGLIIYDECHHAPAEDNKRVLRQLGVFNSDWTGTLLGFTATTSRGDGQGLDQVFEDIVYTKTIQEMILEGYLTPLRGFRINTRADLLHLTGTGDDFSAEELAEAVDIEERNALVARSIQELARDRRTIAFCASVGHAINLSRSLNTLGVPASYVHGGLARDVRAKTLAQFREKRFGVLTNVAVLTEGFDDPEVSCIAMARPMRSAGLYAQCVGRGTRLFPGKKDCLILDFVDLSRLSLCNLPSLFGVPGNLDLEGRDVSEAVQLWMQIQWDHPGFELEAETITLREIQERANFFDPLTLETNRDVRAISKNAWESLGSRGLALHFERKSGKIEEILILSQGSRGRRWSVMVNDKPMEKYSSLEEAVAAVDYEVTRYGKAAELSATEQASWRKRGISQTFAESLPRTKSGRVVTTLGEALRLMTWTKYYPAKKSGKNDGGK